VLGNLAGHHKSPLSGFAVEFAETLRGLGYDARALGCEEQLSLRL
jgi:hypothetical protein